jgi:hypothetical protein
MLALAPWSLARGNARGRRAVLLLLLAALLYGFGLHAARACNHAAATALHQAAASAGSPCHGNGDIDIAEAACEAHCRTDVQSGRSSPSFDLPPAVPLDLTAALMPQHPVATVATGLAPARRDTGPPLHILLHRLLR